MTISPQSQEMEPEFTECPEPCTQEDEEEIVDDSGFVETPKRIQAEKIRKVDVVEAQQTARRTKKERLKAAIELKIRLKQRKPVEETPVSRPETPSPHQSPTPDASPSDDHMEDLSPPPPLSLNSTQTPDEKRPIHFVTSGLGLVESYVLYAVLTRFYAQMGNRRVPNSWVKGVTKIVGSTSLNLEDYAGPSCDNPMLNIIKRKMDEQTESTNWVDEGLDPEIAELWKVIWRGVHEATIIDVSVTPKQFLGRRKRDQLRQYIAIRNTRLAQGTVILESSDGHLEGMVTNYIRTCASTEMTDEQNIAFVEDVSNRNSRKASGSWSQWKWVCQQTLNEQQKGVPVGSPAKTQKEYLLRMTLPTPDEMKHEIYLISENPFSKSEWSPPLIVAMVDRIEEFIDTHKISNLFITGGSLPRLDNCAEHVKMHSYIVTKVMELLMDRRDRVPRHRV